jgi:putative acetyltransferase
VISIVTEHADQPDVVRMLEAGERFAATLYAADECFLLDLSELQQPGVTVFVARADGAAAGMAALVDGANGTAELKRLFVDDAVRGQGVASQLLAALEAHALAHDIESIVLETGTRSHAAIALYEKLGYEHIPPFGIYVGSATSVCMKKSLRAAESMTDSAA